MTNQPPQKPTLGEVSRTLNDLGNACITVGCLLPFVFIGVMALLVALHIVH